MVTMVQNSVLLVENNMRFQAMFKIMLGNSFGNPVAIVNNELEAILKAETLLPALIIIGSSLSTESTQDLIKYLKNSQKTCAIPLMKISANITKKDLMEYVKLGVNDVILVDNFNMNHFILKTKKMLSNTIANNVVKPVQPQQNSIASVSPKAIRQEATNPEKPKVIKTPKVMPSITKPVDSGQEFLEKAKPLITLSLLEKKLSRIASVNPLPFIITELLTLTSSINTNINDLVKLIETDYALTAKVLKLANSAFYRRQDQRIYNLKDAITNIGYFGVKDLALAITTISTIGKGDQNNNQNTLKLWHHSLTTGIIAKEIAALGNHKNPESCFVMGILNNMGLAVLEDHFNKEYQKVIDASLSHQLPLAKVEEKLLGITHKEIGAKVLGIWGFPKNIYLPLSFTGLSFQEIMNLESKYNSIKPDILLVKISECISSILTGNILDTEKIEEIPAEIFTYLSLNISQESLITEIYTIKSVVQEIMQIMLLQVSPEALMSCDSLDKFKFYRPKNVLLLNKPDNIVPSLDIMLRQLKLEVKEVKNQVYEMDILKKDNPELVVIELNKQTTQTYNLEYLKNLEKTVKSLFLLCGENALIEEYSKDLCDNKRWLFLNKPYSNQDVSRCFEDLKDKLNNIL
jgi:HD-like signal output (HDOD) protein/DNA-binding response OmpR family regulator